MAGGEKKRILVEGWRFLPHSYAAVNAFQCLELLRRGDVELFHHDVTYFDARWVPTRGLLDPQSEAAIAAIPRLAPGRRVDGVFRIAFPYNFAPSPASENLVVFGTAEMCCVPRDYLIGGVSLRDALVANPRVRIATPSNWSRQGFIGSGAAPERVSVLQHGADLSIFHPLDETQRARLRRELGWEGFIFLNIGAMTPNKGLVTLLRAFAAVASRVPQAMLVMKGIDALYRSTEMLLQQTRELTDAERAIIEPRLHYRGETLPFTHMATMYQLADAYVSPYTAEGFNMPVLEAAACGLPAICTGGGSTDDFTRDDFALRVDSTVRSGPLADVHAKMLAPDVNSLIDRMMQVIQDSTLREKARRAGPPFVRENFTWKHAVDQLIHQLFDHV